MPPKRLVGLVARVVSASGNHHCAAQIKNGREVFSGEQKHAKQKAGVHPYE
jgi:hypothetical protein